ncbi:MAG: SDR family NAD(P)-dependent oxidoreductase [Gammaproteobacteria bacterium]
MKTILITGSSSDIGIAVAKVLAEQPCRLVLHYFSKRSKSEQLKAWLDEKKIENRLIQADLTQPRQAAAVISETLRQFASLDVLINVVGPFAYKNILEVMPDEWLYDINLNLHSCFFTSHYALEALRRSQGHIVNFAFSGVENIKAWPMSTGYCAAKTGVAALTKSLAVALAPQKVRVNAVCPGLVEEGIISAEERQQMAEQIPFGRPVYPDEIAKTVAWLVWDSPETMTGSLLTVAGGWEY